MPVIKKIIRPKATSWHLSPALNGPASVALKNHFVAMVGEYVGTVLFLFFAFGGTNIANNPDLKVNGVTSTSSLLYISLAFGFSLAVNAWVFFRISGGLFNPAVSLGLVVVGVLPPLRGLLLSISQILGGITAAAIIHAVLPGPLAVRTTLGGGTSRTQGLFLEMFLTAMLLFTIFMLAAEKHKATFLAPIGIGLALFIAELVGVYYTGGSLNPARSFGPCVALREFENYHWIYWVGPILGSLLASGFYKFVKFLQYETVVPGQDSDVVVVQHEDGTEEHVAVPTGTVMEGDDAANLPTAESTNLAITGPGLNDLLGEGAPEDVMALPSQSAARRLEARIAGLERGNMQRGQSEYSMHNMMHSLGNDPATARPIIGSRQGTQNVTGTNAVVTRVARAQQTQQNMDPFANSAGLMLPSGNENDARYDNRAFNNV